MLLKQLYRAIADEDFPQISNIDFMYTTYNKM